MNCRQLHRRAVRRLADGRERLRPSSEDHAELLVRLLAAARGGDLGGLTRLLSAEVIAWTDGGGKTVRRCVPSPAGTR